MVYPNRNCWPDESDLRVMLSKHFKSGTELSPEAMFQDFRVSYEWLQRALHVSHWRGRHERQPLSNLKATAEAYIGHVVNAEAFWAAAITASTRVSAGKSFEKITIRVPAWDHEKIKEAWSRHLEELEAESNELNAANKQ